MIGHSVQSLTRTARRAASRRGAVMLQSLYEKCGGFSTVSRIVMVLYDRLLDDDDIGPFFDDVEMSRVIDHQTKFVASLMGGPAFYSDDQIRKMHDHLPIADRHFARMTEILADTLRDHGIAEEDVAAVVSEFEKRRGLVVRT